MKQKLKYGFIMGVSLLFLCVGLCIALSYRSYAAEAEPIVTVEDLEEEYYGLFDNYYLDAKKADFMDFGSSMMNMMANTMFMTTKNVVRGVCALFYHALNFNLAELFGDALDTLQASMHESVFEPLFLIGFAGSAILILKRFAKRDMVGSFVQVLKVIFIVVLSFFIVSESGTVLWAANNLTASLGAQILSGTGNGSTSDYAAQATSGIWMDLVHRPWEYLEFGDDAHTVEDVASILGMRPNDPVRIDKIENWSGDAFSGDYRPVEKVGFLFFYAPLAFIKSGIFLIMGGILMISQVVAVFYVLLSPLILILAMIPGYESILGNWVKKILETQLSELVMYLIVGLMLRVDWLLYDNLAVSWGWLVVLIAQVILYVGVIFKRNEIFGTFSRMGISNPRTSVEARVHDAKAMKAAILRSVIGTRNIAGVAKAGSAGSKAAKAAGSKAVATKAATTNTKKKMPERPVMANAKKKNDKIAVNVYNSVGKQGYTRTTASSEAYREPLRPTSVTFTERQVKFDFEPSGAFTEASGENRTVQRPRMDAFFSETGHGDWFIDWGREMQAEPTQGRWSENRKETVRTQRVVQQIPERNRSAGEISAAQYREVPGSGTRQERRTSSKTPVRRPQTLRRDVAKK